MTLKEPIFVAIFQCLEKSSAWFPSKKVNFDEGISSATHCSFTPISSDTKGATSASGETRQYRDIGTSLESPKST